MEENTYVQEEAAVQQEPFGQSSTYTVLGNLVLPRPTGYYKKKAEEWEEELRKLDKRNLAGKFTHSFHVLRSSHNINLILRTEIQSRPVNDLNTGFMRFRDQEKLTWEDNGQDMSPKELVRPSGSLESPLALRLNQPSFTTQHVNDGETADPSNGCIAIVMGSGYRHDTLLFDHIHRRSEDSEAIEGDEYPPNVLQCHEQFTDAIAQSMLAKVEVIFGKKVQKRILQQQEIDILPLWGEFEGVLLLLAHETSYGNQDIRYKLRRVMLIACHPQHMYYHSAGDSISIRQEKTLAVAVLMTGDRNIPWIQGYYSKKLWLRLVPNTVRLRRELQVNEVIRKLNLTHSPTILKEDEMSKGSDQMVYSGSWDVEVFNKKPYSNEELREIIIPSALEAIQTASRTSTEWKQLTDFPDPVLKWLKGQKQILFPYLPISSFEDFINSLESFLPSEVRSVKDLLNEILVFQKNHLDQVKGPHQQWWHSQFDGSELEVFCKNCDHPLNTDTSPRWSINRPGFYIVRQTTCSSKVCQVKTALAMPKDTSIDTVSGQSEVSMSSSTSRSTESPIVRYRRVKGVEDTDLPSIVQCWCFECKDETKLFDDREPRWTIGYPLYMERVKFCPNCSKDPLGDSRFTPKRFVPRDSSILSILPTSLRDFHRRYEFLGREAHEILITKQLASSTEPRGLKRKQSKGGQSASKRAKKGN
jgi:hypothetical protein